MATPFPCPNPACTYRFDPAQLPPAAMVTCLLCHTRFPYRAAAPAAAPPPPPAPAPAAPYPQPYGYAPPPPASAPGWPSGAPGWGQTPPPPSYAPPPAPGYPQAPPPGYAPPGYGPPPGYAPDGATATYGGYPNGPVTAPPPQRPAGPRLVNPHLAPRSSTQTFLFLALFTVFIVAGLFIIYNVTQKNPFAGGGATAPQESDLYNFGYEVPAGWNNDVDARGGLQVN